MAKSKAFIDLYRNPSYKSGICSCCRKFLRNSGHPDYPHLCNKCLNTRAALRPAVSFGQLEVDRAIEYAAKVQQVNQLTYAVNDPRSDPLFLSNVYNKLSEEQKELMDKQIEVGRSDRSNLERPTTPAQPADVSALVNKLLN